MFDKEKAQLFTRWPASKYLKIHQVLFENRDRWQNKSQKNSLFSQFQLERTVEEKLDFRGFYFDVGFSFQHLEEIDFSYCNSPQAYKQAQTATDQHFKHRLGLGFSDSILDHCHFRGVDFAGCVRCELTSCYFDEAQISGSGFGVTQAIRNCSFQKTRFKQIFLSRVVFENCDFRGARFDGTCDVEHCRFINCSFDQASFQTKLIKKLAGVDSFLKCEFINSPLSPEQKKQLSPTITIVEG